MCHPRSSRKQRLFWPTSVNRFSHLMIPPVAAPPSISGTPTYFPLPLRSMRWRGNPRAMGAATNSSSVQGKIASLRWSIARSHLIAEIESRRSGAMLWSWIRSRVAVRSTKRSLPSERAGPRWLRRRIRLNRWSNRIVRIHSWRSKPRRVHSKVGIGSLPLMLKSFIGYLWINSQPNWCRWNLLGHYVLTLAVGAMWSKLPRRQSKSTVRHLLTNLEDSWKSLPQKTTV